MQHTINRLLPADDFFVKNAPFYCVYQKNVVLLQRKTKVLPY